MTLNWISYPITQAVRDAQDRFPRIALGIALPKQGRSPLEIVRLLGNTHFEHVRRLLEFLEQVLPASGPLGARLLQQTDPFQFSQCLAEMFLFSHLRQRLGEKVSPVAESSGVAKPDLEIVWQGFSVKIEVYSPVDLMGWQLIEKNLTTLFKYLHVDRGFSLRVYLDPLDESAKGVWYPYSIPKESDAAGWLQDISAKANGWLSTDRLSPGDQLVLQGPGRQTSIRVELEAISHDPSDRRLYFLEATHSTDTRLFFECGTPEDTAKSQWGRKIEDKLMRRQAGPPGPAVIRILVVDFSHADTGWPEFICWPNIARRLSETVHLLVADIPGPLPYDAVLPAHLSQDCFFGSPIWIDVSKKAPGETFVGQAELDRPSQGLGS